MSGITANITYQNVTVDIGLNYNSKNRRIEDTISLSDEISLNVGKYFSDVVYLTDSMTYEMSLGKSLQDTVTASDLVSISMHYAPNFGDVISIDDSNITITVSSSLDFLLNHFMLNETMLN